MSSNAAAWGNDPYNDGSTVRKAKSTIQQALDSDPTVNIYGGLYRESLTVTANTFALEGKGMVVVEAPNPTASFINTRDKFVTIRNLTIRDFATPIRTDGASRYTLLENVSVINTTLSTLLQLGENGTIAATPRQSSMSKCLMVNQNIEIDLDYIESTTIIGGNLQVTRFHDDSGYIKDSILADCAIHFLVEVSIVNSLFSDGSTFTYDDGVNSVNGVDFDTFRTANDTHGWGFNLSGCDTEETADTFLGMAAGNYLLKSTSNAANMAANGGIVGKFRVGLQALASPVGWTNNSNFTLNGDRYEAVQAASIDSPVMDFGKNVLLAVPDGDFSDAFEDGRIFDTLGNLGAAILSGGSASGLNVALTDGEVYCFEGYVEVVTNLRTLAFANMECVTALAGEIIQEVTASVSGSVFPVIDYSGKARVNLRWWKDGAAEPVDWKPAYRGEELLVDANGNTNAEAAYDVGAFPRPPVARYARQQPKVSTNNARS